MALPRSDYPHGARLLAKPATNSEVDVRFGPAHRSTFERLGRRDAEGWLQLALWQFKTGRGAAVQLHPTTFEYVINVFKNGTRARHALADVRLKTRRYRLAHTHAISFRSVDVKQTLLFVFFTYKSIEVESYYSYGGVAPAAIAKRLRHTFSRQVSHLGHLARVLSKRISQNPTAIPTATPTDTPTVVPTSTTAPTAGITPTPTRVVTPSPSPTPRPSSTPAPTATPTPGAFVVAAMMTQPTYAPGQAATLQVHVTVNGQPVAGAQMIAQFYFPGGIQTCSDTTDASGLASCFESVPNLPDGTVVVVEVHVRGPNGQSANTSTTFTVKR